MRSILVRLLGVPDEFFTTPRMPHHACPYRNIRGAPRIHQTPHCHAATSCTENKNGRGDVGLDVTGVSFLKEELVRWQRRTLRTNDVVWVKIIEHQQGR